MLYRLNAQTLLLALLLGFVGAFAGMIFAELGPLVSSLAR